MAGFNIGAGLAGLGQFADYWQKKQQQDREQAIFQQALAEKQRREKALGMLYSAAQSGALDSDISGISGLSGIANIGGGSQPPPPAPASPNLVPGGALTGGGGGAPNWEVAHNNFAGMRMPGVPAAGGPRTNPAGWQTFDTPEAGIGGISRQLDRYASGATTGRPLTTIRDIVSTWAPSSENDTNTLINRADKIVGVGSDQPLNLSDPATKAKLVTAMIANEQGGRVPVSQDVIQRGIASAGSGQPSRPGIGQPTDLTAGLRPQAQQTAQAAARSIDPFVYGRMSMKALASAIDKANPDADPVTKMMALEEAQKLMAPDQRQLFQMMMLQNRQDMQMEIANARIQDADFRAQFAAQNRAGTIVQQDGHTYRIGAPNTEPEEIHFPGTGPVNKLGSSAQNPPDPAGIKYVVDKIGHYQMAPLSGWALRSPFGQAVTTQLAKDYPDYDQTKYQQKQRTEIAGTTGRQGDSVRSFSVALSHLAIMDQAAEALANGDVQTLNRLTNAIQKEFGYLGPVDFNFVKSIVGDEVTKAVIGGVGSVTDRQQLQQGFDMANSPEQLANVALRAKQLMAGQLSGYRRQLTSGGMSEGDFDKMLSPEAKQELGALGPDGQGAPQSGGPSPSQTQQGAHPPVPPSLADKPGLQWSPSQKLWRDGSGAIYDQSGAAVP